MSGHVRSSEGCHRCGDDVDLETGVEIRVEQGFTEIRRTFCEECATVGCSHCGIDLPIRSVLAERGTTSTERTECVRCEQTVPLRDAVEIRHSRNRGYRKRVCGDCLDEIAVPPDFKVVRELSPASQ